MNRRLSNPIQKFLLAAFAVVAVGVSTNTASANEYGHINRMAVKIRNQTRQLLRETEHYRLTPNYRFLVSDAAALRQLAEHTREVARQKGNLDHLAADVAEMDRTFHHLENLFDNTELLASQCQGSVKGHTAHVKRLLNSIEDCIHHIQSDIDVLRRAVVIAPPAVVQRPVIVQRPVVVQRPAIDTSCPYSGRVQGQPIITNVETIQVPARDVYRSNRSYSAYGGGFNFSFGGSRLPLQFNF